jgi:prepilin-type N-terminal cleavage/methylation domain-containing protein
MLNIPRCQGARVRARGFSLVEMMVAMLIGAIVMVGAVSLIVAIDRSNSETIQATRVNQELRALASVIGDEIKRARRMHDPIVYVGQGGTASGPFDTVDTSTAGCIVYGYQDAVLNDTSVNAAVNNYQAIYLKTTNGVGSVIFAKGTAAVSCTSSGITLSSSQLNVTALTFSCVTTNGTTVSDASTSSTTTLPETCNEIDMTLSATLTSGDVYEKTISHTYVQQIFIRSGAAKTS